MSLGASSYIFMPLLRAKAYAAEEFAEFLRHRPMEAVLIGSPSGCHAEQGIAAARAGLHVLTEKPIDVSTKRADALIAAAEAAGVKLGVMFQDRTKAHVRALKWWRPEEYYAGSRWRGTLALDGGGALINQGIHTVDLLLWLLGDVRRVEARVGTLVHKIEAEDTAVAVLEFASGAMGTLVATTAAYPGYPRRVEITGTEGTVVLEHDRIVAAEVKGGRDLLGELGDGARDENASATSAAVSDVRGHRMLIEDFLGAIREGRAPLCDGREGRRSLALVEEIYRVGRG